jgi:hypothetical protein
MPAAVAARFLFVFISGVTSGRLHFLRLERSFSVQRGYNASYLALDLVLMYLLRWAQAGASQAFKRGVNR